MAFRIRGGGAKKRKSEDGVVDTSRIPEIIGEMMEKQTDCDGVKQCFATKEMDILEVLGTMPLDEMTKMKDFLAKNEGRGHSDFMIRAMSKYALSIQTLEALPHPLHKGCIRIFIITLSTVIFHTGHCDFPQWAL